jgi:hypothetical protein
MTYEIGRVEAVFRYPIKSMAAERLDDARLGWHGIEGDRRLAVRRKRERSGFPWLTASKLPDLLRFVPLRPDDALRDDPPTHVRTPEGDELAVFGEDLSAELERRHGAPLEMMHMRGGVFDEANVSVITTDTVRAIGEAAGVDADVRRFRPNIVVRLLRPVPFEEDGWPGHVLVFGELDEGPRMSVTKRDARCSIVNLDPDSARAAPEVLKAVVRRNQNNAGVYGAVIRAGEVATGQAVHLQESR